MATLRPSRVSILLLARPCHGRSSWIQGLFIQPAQYLGKLLNLTPFEKSVKPQCSQLSFLALILDGETDARNPPPPTHTPFHPSPAWSNLHAIVLPRSKTQLQVPSPSGPPDPPDQAFSLRPRDPSLPLLWEELRVNFFFCRQEIVSNLPLTNGPGNNGETPNTQLPCSAALLLSGPRTHLFGAATNSQFYVTRDKPPPPCIKK